MPGIDQVRALGLDPHQQPLQGFLVLRADRHPDRRRVVLVVAQVEPVQRVLAAVPADVVQDAGQQPGVHQVAGDLDRLGDLHGCLLRAQLVGLSDDRHSSARDGSDDGAVVRRVVRWEPVASSGSPG